MSKRIPMYELNECEIQLLSDMNRLYLSTYEVQWKVKDLKKMIRSAQRCLDNRIKEKSGGDKIKVIEAEEHEDGSATLQVECDPKTFAAIASYGISRSWLRIRKE